MIKSSVGSGLDRLIHKLFPFLFVRPLNPDLLTVTGALVSTLAAAAFMQGRLPWAGLLMLAGGFFDLVDGVVARHQGISTRFGAFLDSTLDRFVDMALFVGIAVHFARQGDVGSVLLTGVALTATVLVSYSKARAELYVDHFDVGLLERGERIGLLAAGAVFDLLIPVLWIVAIGSTITAGQRFALAKRELDRLDAEDARAATDPAGSTELEEPTA
ncbi:MAG TPA: CDP-alcohol phosphatidyltransferase family protein [Candidatus Polarisedimenticolia bacterium]|nr:CDP-alcohol phosphatidyltransferase family protein [Candidatus Polarisedimenticolia bacterium]